MKKLLFQFDTDSHAAVFDTVVGYDGGADHVIGHGGCTPENITALVEGAIFTRGPSEKKNTALFIGGSDITEGEVLLEAIKKVFFDAFRVSIMLDSNGSNTTAAAIVANLLSSGPIAGRKVVILGGTGPVGCRSAYMMACENAASIVLCSRKLARSEQACEQIKKRFGVDIEPAEASTNDDRGKLIEDAQIVIATGAAGVELLEPQHWQDNTNIEMIADANATPPMGVGGTDMMDKGEVRSGKIVWGAIGLGKLKLALHRACIKQLFESTDRVLDAEEIFKLAKEMA